MATEGIDFGKGRISEDDIRRLAEAFYEKIRADPELAPIFKQAIPGDQDPFLATKRDFWSSPMLANDCFRVVIRWRFVCKSKAFHRAWIDPDYKARMLADTKAAAFEMGIETTEASW